jgi:hypothetical protein
MVSQSPYRATPSPRYPSALPPRTPLTLTLTLTLTLPSLRAGPASALTSVTFSTPFPALPSFVPS